MHTPRVIKKAEKVWKILKVEDGGGMVSLSELPEPIIHQILSSFTALEAAKICNLSKSWLIATNSRPNWDFDYQVFTSELKKEKKEKKYREALEYTISTLLRYQEQDIGVIDRLRFILCPSIESCNSLVDRCIALALKHQTRNLELGMSTTCYTLSEPVFGVKSLGVLRLTRCNLQHHEIKCRNLRELYLKFVSLDEQMFESITGSCTLIETLDLTSCRKIRHIKVTNLPNLKRLTTYMSKGQIAEVGAAPSLEWVEYGGVRDPENLATPWMNFRESPYRYLKSLSLSSVKINESFFAKLGHKFPRIEELSVICCSNLGRIAIWSSSLKKIRLVCDQGPEEAHFDAPNVVLFEFKGSNYAIPKLSFGDVSGRGWASRVRLTCYNPIDESWFAKLKGFLIGISQSQVCLHVRFHNDVSFNENGTEKTLESYQDLEIEELCIPSDWRKMPSTSVLAMLNGIFWACRPRMVTHCFEYNLTKLLYQMLSLRSNSHPRFWNPYFKGVKDTEIFKSVVCNHWKKQAGRGVKLPEALDWRNFWYALSQRLEFQRDIISFILDWAPSCDAFDKPCEAKRLKSSHQHLA